MAEERRLGLSLRHKYAVVSLVRDHRVNDLILGHVGRLTYVPPENTGHRDEDGDSGKRIGMLLINRIIRATQTFRQVMPFRTWYEPPSPAIPDAIVDSSQFLKDLLQDAPEALEGISGPPYNSVLDGLREGKFLKPSQTRLPLLTHGIISDLRLADRGDCPVLAMATGESGHALRIVRSQQNVWAWAASGNVTVELNSIDTEDEGYWCGNALSINQIKFAASEGVSKQTPRWMFVQTAAETLVFEPTLRKIPVIDTEYTCNHISHGPSYITMDPKIRIPVRATGGQSHCDMAFNPATGATSPQLVIIDEGGNWSLWNLFSNRYTSKTTLQTVLCSRGNLLDGVVPSPSVTAADGLGHLHRVAWLPASTAALEIYPAERQSKVLLLANATSVNVINIDRPAKPIYSFNVVHSASMDIVGDIQISPTNPSHVFVLTTAAILWFDLSRLNDYNFQNQEADATPGTSQFTTNVLPRTRPGPILLLSCPHLRDPADRTIKLCLVATTLPGGGNAIVAFVYSIKHPEKAIFWFPDVPLRAEAKYEQQVFHFDQPHGEILRGGVKKTRLLGEQTILVLPKHPQIVGHSKYDEENFGQEYVKAGVGLFQVISLRPDLSLQWTLCSCSPTKAPVSVAAPFLQRKRENKRHKFNFYKRRKETIEFFANRFAVPDGFEDDIIPGDLKSPTQTSRRNPIPPLPSDAERLEVQKSPAATFEVYNMAMLNKLLNRKLTKAGATAYQATSILRGFQRPSPLDMIQQMIEVASEYGSFAYTTLLNISNTDYVKEYGADLTDFSWTKQLLELGPIEERKISIFDHMRGYRCRSQSGGAATLYEAMAQLCAISLDSDNGQYSHDVLARWQGLLAYVAVRLFFSQISMVVMPSQVAYSARNTPGAEDTQSNHSTLYSTHFPRPEITTSHVHDILSSSPVQRSVPNWLLSSSQDYGPEGTQSPNRAATKSYFGAGAEALSTKETGEQDTEATEDDLDDEKEDPAIGRLRQFAKSIKSEPPRDSGELRLLSHWQLGSDPAEFYWVPLGAIAEAEQEMRRQAQEARNKPRKINDKRAMRERERLLMVGGPASVGASSPAARIYPGSQALSSQAYASQTQASPAIMSSQVFSSQVLPSSQPVIHSGGPFGLRPKKKKKKKPLIARGFK